MPKPRVALQVFSVREELVRDFNGTIRAIAAMGYPAVQMAWFASEPDAAELKSLLDGLGLAVAGCHVLLESLESRADFEIERCLQLDTPDVVIPWLAPERRPTTRSACQQLADVMNRVGARCKEMGARLSYHNHEFELQRIDGETMLDHFMHGTDPDLVKLEPDVYWVKYGGFDPVALLEQYAGRCPLIHLKDMTAGPNPTYAEIGAGVIDFKPIFATAEANGTEWYIVEQDETSGSAIDAVALSLRNLRSWGKL